MPWGVGWREDIPSLVTILAYEARPLTYALLPLWDISRRTPPAHAKENEAGKSGEKCIRGRLGNHCARTELGAEWNFARTQQFEIDGCNAKVLHGKAPIQHLSDSEIRGFNRRV